MKIMNNELLALADLKDMSEEQIKDHLARNYSGGGDGYYSQKDLGHEQDYREMLNDYDILIAYESVGDWGCDSSSQFLLKHKTTGELFKITGSHCSCYGFEGQGELYPVVAEQLKAREGYGVLSTGGYDNDQQENIRLVKQFYEKL